MLLQSLSFRPFPLHRSHKQAQRETETGVSNSSPFTTSFAPVFNLVPLIDPCVFTVGRRVVTQTTTGISAGSDLNAEQGSARRQPVLVFACAVFLIRG